MRGPYQDIKREVELVLAAILKEKTSIEFMPYKGDPTINPPFGVVSCAMAKPLVGGKDPRGYMCNVKVVYVTHIDDATTIEHSQKVARIEDALNLIPQMEVEDYKLEENHIEIAGMFMETLEDASEDQSHGDVFRLLVGVRGRCDS